MQTCRKAGSARSFYFCFAAVHPYSQIDHDRSPGICLKKITDLDGQRREFSTVIVPVTDLL